MHLTLTRRITANGAVVGVLTGLSKTLYTLEDAWQENKRGISCIPTGTYEARPHGWDARSSVKFQRVWQLQNVPGRSAILIHAGNTHRDTEGCILVGMTLSVTQLQSSVFDSKAAIDLMRHEIGQAGFSLIIE